MPGGSSVRRPAGRGQGDSPQQRPGVAAPAGRDTRNRRPIPARARRAPGVPVLPTLPASPRSSRVRPRRDGSTRLRLAPLPGSRLGARFAPAFLPACSRSAVSVGSNFVSVPPLRVAAWPLCASFGVAEIATRSDFVRACSGWRRCRCRSGRAAGFFLHLLDERLAELGPLRTPRSRPAVLEVDARDRRLVRLSPPGDRLVPGAPVRVDPRQLPALPSRSDLDLAHSVLDHPAWYPPRQPGVARRHRHQVALAVRHDHGRVGP